MLFLSAAVWSVCNLYKTKQNCNDFGMKRENYKIYMDSWIFLNYRGFFQGISFEVKAAEGKMNGSNFFFFFFFLRYSSGKVTCKQSLPSPAVLLWLCMIRVKRENLLE